MTKLFYDSEFTGLTQNTSLISLAFVSEAGESLYAEFSDYKQNQVDDWLRANVLPHCLWLNDESRQPFVQCANSHTEVYGDSAFVAEKLATWFDQFSAIEIWADCLAWDWVLLAQLYGGAFGLPKHIHYMPGDLSTLFRVKGLEPDTSREEFAGTFDAVIADVPVKHNALWDALVVRACYHKLIALD